jgi:hypothetical protein
VIGRDGGGGPADDHEVLVSDRYLDALLAAVDRQATDAPADASLPPELRETARLLRRSLVRVHPSFRFEERLAARLAQLAAVHAASPRRLGSVVPFPRSASPAASGSAAATDPLLGAILAGQLDPAADTALDIESRLGSARRPLILGGALTSAAISIVGVALVAWRATRPAGRTQATAMTRAARAAHARQAMATGLSGTGMGGPA